MSLFVYYNNGMNVNEIIIKNLKAIQNNSDLNETQFALKCKIHQRTYNRIINNESVPKIDILEAIANANDLSVWQLLVPGVNPKNPPMLKEPSDKERQFYESIKLAAQQLAKLDD
jgi:transcriptional regulator with XRE-family HTH domain